MNTPHWFGIGLISGLVAGAFTSDVVSVFLSAVLGMILILVVGLLDNLFYTTPQHDFN